MVVDVLLIIQSRSPVLRILCNLTGLAESLSLPLFDSPLKGTDLVTYLMYNSGACLFFHSDL